MVIFKELRVTPDEKSLIVDVSSEGAYIDSIVIDTEETYVEDGPSSNPAYSYTVPDISNEDIEDIPDECGCHVIFDEDGNKICYDVDDIGVKKLRLKVDGLQKHLFFVYVITTEGNVMNVTADLHPYYREMMSYVREVEDNCDIPKWFIDYFLRLEALLLSLKTGHYMKAVYYWDKFFKEEHKCDCYEGD